ncbi:MAG TPA: dihydroxyacetone kinase subunit L [Gammaproteobacteria bacterium]|nr:dihydroxyacetone kinase subunit L [Gammaproteobacteria bacterium]
MMTAYQLPDLIAEIKRSLNDNAVDVAELDRILGDGDHLTNLQRGIAAVDEQITHLQTLSWPIALKQIGMTLLSTMGGASGSLYGSLFIKMAASLPTNAPITIVDIAASFTAGVEAVKQRGKSDQGEKTLLDTLIPSAEQLQYDCHHNTDRLTLLRNLSETAIAGMLSTQSLIATKGRAALMGDKAIGHIDAGAKTSQLIICSIVAVLLDSPA